MMFDEAFEVLLKHEGGYSDHDMDPGGKTKYGITEAVAREVGYRGSMKELPRDLAKRIYRDRYWNAVHADQLPEKLRYAVFDAAVNSGPGQAARWLQRAVGAVVDGVIGPRTIAAAGACNHDKAMRVMLAARLTFMTGLSIWPAFGKGWARRIASLMEQ